MRVNLLTPFLPCDFRETSNKDEHNTYIFTAYPFLVQQKAIEAECFSEVSFDSVTVNRLSKFARDREPHL